MPRRAERWYLTIPVICGVTVLALSGCSIGSSCRMSAKESDSFEELVFSPDKGAPAEYRVKGIYREGFERSELDLGTSEAPIVYCILYMDRRFGSDLVDREMSLIAIVTYEKDRELDCPFGTLTIKRIIEAKSMTTNPIGKNRATSSAIPSALPLLSIWDNEI